MPAKLSQEEAEKRIAAKGLTLLGLYRGSNVKVLVRCRCGKSFSAAPSNIFNDGVLSCGCAYSSSHDEITKKLTGVRVALLEKHTDIRVPVRLKCLVCGDEFKAPVRYLLYCKYKKKCSCNMNVVAKASGGELRISAALDRYGCTYTKEWSREPSKSNRNLRYDFYIHNRNAIIEFNGEQHFNADNGLHRLTGRRCGRGKEAAFAKLQANDKEKRDWAAANGIPLLDIDYDEIDQVEEKVWNFLMELRQRKSSMVA
jgi:predicted  nucleic acid-binding Zn-ribbon protein